MGDNSSDDTDFESDEFQDDLLALYLNQIDKNSIRSPDEIEVLCKQLEQVQADFFASVMNGGSHENIKFLELRYELLIRTIIDDYHSKHKAAPSFEYIYKKMRSGRETRDDRSRRLILVPKFLAKFNRIFRNEISYQNQWRYWRVWILKQFNAIELSSLLRQKLAFIDEIKAELVKSHLLLVVWVARRYYPKIKDIFVFQDIIQEGNIGLMRAADHYDYSLGHRFSTYALWWIKYFINRAIQFQINIFYRAKGFFEKKNQFRRSYALLIQKLGREPTLGEVAKNVGWTEEETVLIMRSFQDVLSFDNPVQVQGGDGSNDSPFGEFLSDELSASSEDVLLAKELETLTSRAVDTLDARLGEIIRLRFGLRGGEEHTLEEIGQKFRISRERIRQLEEQALRQLKPLLKRLKNET